ncbi:hypothetical protein [Glycomyces xiaoerkulensis]|uniref:hypothetical protein n=1 Tax=Glycomyces xiaoerkulensis TaxID=2038139 RepID=UPI0012FFE8FC|nr:hypothetical protein [Glycomyces xiaoerkulensis]
MRLRRRAFPTGLDAELPFPLEPPLHRDVVDALPGPVQTVAARRPRALPQLPDQLIEHLRRVGDHRLGAEHVHPPTRPGDPGAAAAIVVPVGPVAVVVAPVVLGCDPVVLESEIEVGGRSVREADRGLRPGIGELGVDDHASAPRLHRRGRARVGHRHDVPEPSQVAVPPPARIGDGADVIEVGAEAQYLIGRRERFEPGQHPRTVDQGPLERGHRDAVDDGDLIGRDRPAVCSDSGRHRRCGGVVGHRDVGRPPSRVDARR